MKLIIMSTKVIIFNSIIIIIIIFILYNIEDLIRIKNKLLLSIKDFFCNKSFGIKNKSKQEIKSNLQTNDLINYNKQEFIGSGENKIIDLNNKYFYIKFEDKFIKKYNDNFILENTGSLFYICKNGNLIVCENDIIYDVGFDHDFDLSITKLNQEIKINFINNSEDKFYISFSTLYLNQYLKFSEENSKTIFSIKIVD